MHTGINATFHADDKATQGENVEGSFTSVVIQSLLLELKRKLNDPERKSPVGSRPKSQKLNLGQEDIPY